MTFTGSSAASQRIGRSGSQPLCEADLALRLRPAGMATALAPRRATSDHTFVEHSGSFYVYSLCKARNCCLGLVGGPTMRRSAPIRASRKETVATTPMRRCNVGFPQFGPLTSGDHGRVSSRGRPDHAMLVQRILDGNADVSGCTKTPKVLVAYVAYGALRPTQLLLGRKISARPTIKYPVRRISKPSGRRASCKSQAIPAMHRPNQ